MPNSYIPNVSVKIDITHLEGVKLGVTSGVGTVNFDVKAKLEERERKSQCIIVGFHILIVTKPGILKFQVEGTATLTGKDEDLSNVLEIDEETKVPRVLQRIYQKVFTAVYLCSTVLDVPPPPHNVLGSISPETAEMPVATVEREEVTETQTAEANTVMSTQQANP